jgi:hypothetical protein
MYIFPRRREVVLGGTYVPDNYSKVPTRDVAQEIVLLIPSHLPRSIMLCD